jgi:signal transduction histidine kinase
MGATAAIVGLFLWSRIAEPVRTDSLLAWGIATIRLAIESAVFFWAATRRELEPRLRLALVMIGGLGLISMGFEVWPLVSAATGWPPIPREVGGWWMIASYFTGIAPILLLPMAPFRRDEWWTFSLDMLVSVGGFVTVSWVLRVGPNLQQTHGSLFDSVSFLSLASSAAMLVALNLLTLRRRAIPSTRAFWLLVSGQAAYLMMTLVFGFSGRGVLMSTVADACYLLGVIPSVWAAWAMRRDPIPAADDSVEPHWFRSFNPFALVMPAVTGGALVLVVETGPAPAVRVLALATAAITTLLALRLVLTVRDNDRQIRSAAELQSRAQSERLDALQRAAGGVAHVFNNALTAVIGYAEMGRAQSGTTDTRQSFEHIRNAAERSARFTRHLLWFTGRQHQKRACFPADDWLRSLEQELRALTGDAIALDIRPAAEGVCIDADAEQLHDALFELVRNAVEAMPDGGTLLVRTDRVPAANAAGARALQASDTAQWRLTVRDSGRGIDPAQLTHVFEPFFSSRQLGDAHGLGLSVVHGVVRAHGGSVIVDSTPGRGTEVQVLLPAADDGAGAFASRPPA